MYLEFGVAGGCLIYAPRKRQSEVPCGLRRTETGRKGAL